MTVTSTVILWALVGVAAAWDISQRRIPNALILTGLLVGFVTQAQLGGFAGLGLAASGAGLALLVLIGPFAMNIMGGGDVKLAMVCGAFLGWRGALHVILIGTVVHSVVALLFLGIKLLAQRTGQAPSWLERVPHALGFAVATILYTLELLVLF